MSRAVGQRIQVRDPWPVERVLDFVRQVSTPLIAFHKQYDLQHLHLHPGNVFVEETSGKPQFQVADLGLASQVGAGTLILAAIRERRTTPEFLSPEQLQGSVPTSQSDVYAFGAMVFQLFSGVPPFPYSGESLSAYALHVAKTSPPRFRDVSDQLNIDSYLESIILRCLAKKPEGRPGSIQEFVESYEMAYRDFQTRTLSGLKLSQLEEPHSNEFRKANPPSPPVGQIPSKPNLPSSAPSPVSLPPKPAAPTALPASDMIPSTLLPPVRNNQIPYRALPHGTDTQVEMPKGSGASRAVLHESQAILLTVSPLLSPWSGMGDEASKLDARKSQPGTDVLPASSETSRPAATPLENHAAHEQPMGALLSNDSPSESASRVSEPPRREVSSAPPPATFQRPRESERDQSASVQSRGVGSRTPIDSGQTMSPSFEPPPETPSDFGSQADSNLTMQMQKDWLRSQLPAAVPQAIAPGSQAPVRFEAKASGPPKVVLLLAVAILVAIGSALFYGRVIAQRIENVVKKCVAKKDFKQARATLQQTHPLARVWLNPDEEIQLLLNNGLVRVGELRKERNVAEAVLLTGYLEVAFALKSSNEDELELESADKPRLIRQELAQELQNDMLFLADKKRLDEVWMKLNGEAEAEFRKVAKMLFEEKLQSAETPDFDIKAVKLRILQKGFDLAKQDTAAGEHEDAFKVLDTWYKRLGSDDAIEPPDREKLRVKRCEARVRMTLLAANEASRPGLARFRDAIEMLDKLLGDLDRDSCAQHRPAVLLARGQIKLAEAQTKSDFVAETTKRFEDSRKDFDDALSALGQQPTDLSDLPTKSDVLQARSAMRLARGVWHKSRDSKDDRTTQPLLEAVREFKAALTDVPNLVEAQRHLKEIRELAQSSALETFESAQATKSTAEADQHYCKAIRQLTLVIEGSPSQEDDGMARSARLLRGLASSSLKSPDYENGIADLSQAVIGVPESQLAEVSEHLAADFDAEQRIHWGRRWVAVARGRLAWLVATCDQAELREQAKSKIRPVDLALLAVRSLEELVLDSQRGVVKVEDSSATMFLMDRGEAWKSHVVALMDAGDFTNAIERIRIAQGYLDSKDKVWKADLSAILEQLQVGYAQKDLPFRMKSPIGSVRPCRQE